MNILFQFAIKYGRPNGIPSWSPLPTPVHAPGGLLKISPDNNPLPAFKRTEVSGATSYEVQMDSGSWTNIGNRLIFVQPVLLAQGNHTFCVRAMSGTGNHGLAASLNFNISIVANLTNTQINFDSHRDTGDDYGEAYVMNSDFTNPVRLTFTVGNGSQAWSPDGTKIAFHSIRDGNNILSQWQLNYLSESDSLGFTRDKNYNKFFRWIRISPTFDILPRFMQSILGRQQGTGLRRNQRSWTDLSFRQLRHIHCP